MNKHNHLITLLFLTVGIHFFSCSLADVTQAHPAGSHVAKSENTNALTVSQRKQGYTWLLAAVGVSLVVPLAALVILSQQQDNQHKTPTTELPRITPSHTKSPDHTKPPLDRSPSLTEKPAIAPLSTPFLEKVVPTASLHTPSSSHIPTTPSQQGQTIPLLETPSSPHIPPSPQGHIIQITPPLQQPQSLNNDVIPKKSPVPRPETQTIVSSHEEVQIIGGEQITIKTHTTITRSPSKKPIHSAPPTPPPYTTPPAITTPVAATTTSVTTTLPRSPKKRKLNFNAPVHATAPCGVRNIPLKQASPSEGGTAFNEDNQHVTPQRRSSLPLTLMQEIMTPSIKLRPRRASLPTQTPGPKTFVQAITERRTAIKEESPEQTNETPLTSPDITIADPRYTTPTKQPVVQPARKNAAAIAIKGKALHQELEKPSKPTGNEPKSLLPPQLKGQNPDMLSRLQQHLQPRLAQQSDKQLFKSPSSPEGSDWQD